MVWLKIYCELFEFILQWQIGSQEQENGHAFAVFLLSVLVGHRLRGAMKYPSAIEIMQ